MFETFINAFFLVIEWPTIGFLILGILMGVWVGTIPGLGVAFGLVMLLPFTYSLDPVPAFALLLGMFAITTTSDTIASVLLGIPGTAASQATILDGHPLAQKGQAARALGAAFTVSAFGGIFGSLVLAASVPIVLPIILSFNSPEIFMLCVLALSMVGSLCGMTVSKGLVVAGFGLVLSTIGYAETMSIPRFALGSDYLTDKLPLIPVVLGLFGIPEIIDMATRNTSIARIPKDKTEGGNILDGIKDAWRHRWLALRCAFIGTYVGMLPGLGAAVVDWIAYGHAVQSAKDKSQFGKGDIRGVIAPEAANNAVRGGSLIPTVAFGIPSDVGTAILLGALLIKGLKPGPEMLTTDISITYSMVWTLVIANIFCAIFLMFVSKHITKITFLPGHMLVPGITLFIFMGAWIGTASLGDLVSCTTFGFIGFIMKRGDWPRPPLILALVLGSIMENAFLISVSVYDGFSWLWERPVVLIIWVLIAITVFLATRGITTNKTKYVAKQDRKISCGVSVQNPIISLSFSIALFALFVIILGESIRSHSAGIGFEPKPWPFEVSLFPIVIVILGAILVFFTLLNDGRGYLAALKQHGSFGSAWAHASEAATFNRSVMFLGYLVVTILVISIIGQKLALPLFIFAYLIHFGRYNWRIALGYATVAWAFLVIFYDLIMHLFWYPSWLYSWLPDLLPAWLPSWLFV